MNKIEKFATQIDASKTKELGYGTLEVIISKETKDRHGEVIKLDGINTKHYNGIVLWGHDYSALPVGKTLKIWKDKVAGVLKAKIQMAVDEYPFAKTVYDLIKGGYLTDVSIGGLVEEFNQDGITINKLEMVEFSIVPIGANRDAKIIGKGLELLGKTEDDLKKEYQEAISKNFADKLKTVESSELKDAVKSLKIILAALEGEVDTTSTENADKIPTKKLITIKNLAGEADRQVESVIKTIKVKLREQKEK